MKKGKKIIGILLVLLFAYLYAHVAKTNLIYDKKADSSDYISLGTSPTVVEQEFVCDAKSLDGIAIKCQLFGEMKNIAVCMTLKDAKDHQVLASVEQKADIIENGKFHSFSFETIEECKGRTYIVSLESEEEVGFVCHSLTEEGTELMIDGEQREGTLIMKTVTKGFDIETFGVALLMIAYIYFFFRMLIRLFSR